MNKQTEEKLGKGVLFERIRRITGYLGSVAQWNNAKKSELRDRVKHGLTKKTEAEK